MASLDSIVSVTITATTTTPSRAGFGTPLIAAFHTVFAGRVRSYGSTAAMVADGFLATDPVVRAATAMFSQNPRPPTIKIGRRASAFSQSINLTPTDTTEGFVYTFSVVSPDGTVIAVTFTNGAAETVATIVTALTALFTAIGDLTAVDNVTDLDLDADIAGELFDVQIAAASRQGVDLLDITADPGLTADLAAIRLEDADWYGLALDSNSKAEIAVATAWAEAETLIFAPNSADAEVLDDTAGNIAETLEAAAFGRTFLMWSGKVLSYAGAAWLGKQLPTDPGSSTWALKTLAGLTVDALTDTEIAALESNNANHYTSVASVNITRQGTTADGDFIDIQRTIDALTARIQEDVFAVLVNLPKLPYTNASVTTVKGTVRGSIRAFQPDGISTEVDITVTAPLVEDIAVADRANRILPDVEFTAQLAGAIHKVNIQGVLTI